MAQLKDTVVNGSLRATDSLLSTTAQFKILNAPTAAGGTTYGPGTAGNVLSSDGTTIYWRGVKNNTSVGVLGWSSQANDAVLITSNTLAYWNGRHSGTASNLKYCIEGEFGNIVTYKAATTNTASTAVVRDASGNFSAGTITATLSGNANTATALYLTAENVSASSVTGALQAFWNANKTTLTRDKVISFSSSHSGRALHMGYFIGGYDNNPYGGFFTAFYGTPYYSWTSNGTFNCKQIWKSGDSVTSAVWNDYAEYRKCDLLPPGACVQEQDDGHLIASNKRLIPGASIISDTWGFSQGKTKEANTPIAVSGRVLAYTFLPRYMYHAGQAVCSAPGGTVDIMTRKEIQEYPDAIIGIVSEIPDYDEWGGGETADREPVKVNGRIWIKIK